MASLSLRRISRGGPQLLQANYKEINYNKLITPNVPTSNVQLAIYEATKSAAVARVAQNMLVMEPNTSQLAVSETVVVQNNSTTTYNNEELGGLRFYLPAAANGQVRVSAQGPGGMPLPRPAEKTSESDTYQVNFPIKPGESQFEISYVLVAGSPLTFHGRVVNVKGMPAGPLRLIAPPGVTMAGSDVQLVGTEPKTQATIYTVLASNLFSVDVTGTGTLHPPEDATPGDGESPPVTEGAPPIYAQLPWLLTLALSVLGIGLVYLFRNFAGALAIWQVARSKLAGLWKFYGDYPALRNFSLTIPENSCLALLGRNGAGRLLYFVSWRDCSRSNVVRCMCLGALPGLGTRGGS